MLEHEAFAIIATVAEHHDVAPRIILGDSRVRRYCDIRKQASYLIHKVLGLSPEQIGRAVGGMDQSSIRYLLEQAEVQYNVDPCYASEVDRLHSIASKTIADFRKHPLNETIGVSHAKPLDIAKRVMRSPRGEIHISGADMRVLAEAYLDNLLSQLDGVSATQSAAEKQ